MSDASVFDRAARVLKALQHHRNGATIKELVAYIERTSVDPMIYMTVRDQLLGMSKLGIVYKKSESIPRGKQYRWFAKVF